MPNSTEKENRWKFEDTILKIVFIHQFNKSKKALVWWYLESKILIEAHKTIVTKMKHVNIFRDSSI